MVSLNDGFKERAFAPLSALLLRPEELLRLAEKTHGPVYILHKDKIAFVLFSALIYKELDSLGSGNSVHSVSNTEATIQTVPEIVDENWVEEVEALIDSLYESIKPTIPQEEWIKLIDKEGDIGE